jgi:hypothetical protein
MVSVPVDFTEAGTEADRVASAGWVGITVVGSAGEAAVVVVDALVVVVELLELDEHAAPSTAMAPIIVATAAFRNPRWVGMS